MYAIQNIRKLGPWLVLIIGLGLFAFIAEDAVRVIQTTFNLSRNDVGKVYSESLSIQEFQEMVNDETEMYKLRSGQNLTDAQQDQIRDQVWNSFVVYQLVKHETDKLGLYVSEAEFQQALQDGTAQSLQTLSMFTGQSGHFDFSALQTFLKQYKEIRGKAQGEQLEQIETIHKMWEYAQKQLRKELLMNKYQSLFLGTALSNPVVAEMSFNDRNNTTTAVVAALPYAAMKDKVEVSDADLKSAYDKYKEDFRIDQELRDIKYIDVEVTASAADKKALDEEMKGIYEKLVAAEKSEDCAAIVGGSKSVTRFADMPLSANAFPMDIRQRLDSMASGQTKAPYLNAQDNTVNTIKLISKTSTADSILYRGIFVQGDEATIQTRQDSILKALAAGAKFKDIAKKYGQQGDSTWVTSAQLEAGASQPDNVKFAKALYEGNGVSVVDIQGNKFIIDVMQKKGSSPKYLAAVVKCNIDFSKETYNNAMNKMNLFVSKNNDLAAVVKAAAKEGYNVVDCKNFSASVHNIGANGRMPGVAGTKEAVRWVFDDAKEGQISKIYECGDANNHILLVGLDAVHKKGYLPYDNDQVKETLTGIVTAEKKGEIAAKQLNGVKTIAAAQQKGCVVDTLKNSSFFQTPFIGSTQAPEAKVAAALATAKVGQVTAPVIGNAGAYLLQVLSHDKGTAKFEKEMETNMAAQQIMQSLQGAFQGLAEKANIVDHRYKF